MIRNMTEARRIHETRASHWWWALGGHTYVAKSYCPITAGGVWIERSTLPHESVTPYLVVTIWDDGTIGIRTKCRDLATAKEQVKNVCDGTFFPSITLALASIENAKYNHPVLSATPATGERKYV